MEHQTLLGIKRKGISRKLSDRISIISNPNPGGGGERFSDPRIRIKPAVEQGVFGLPSSGTPSKTGAGFSPMFILIVFGLFILARR